MPKAVENNESYPLGPQIPDTAPALMAGITRGFSLL